MKIENIPEELKACNQWVLWRLEEKPGQKKPAKMPYSITGARARANDPETWNSFEEVVKAFNSNGKSFNGIGFEFTAEDPFVFIDIDGIVTDDGKIPGEIRSFIEEFSSYTEYSQSKKGFHVISKGKIPGDRNRKGQFEIYEKGRFVALTGDVIGNNYREIKDRQEVLDRFYKWVFREEEKPQRKEATGSLSYYNTNLSDVEVIELCRKAKNENKFHNLFYSGEISGYSSQSEADLALCNIIAFYTQDEGQIDNIFKQSALYDEKWDREDYSQRTIRKALDGLKEVYRGKRLQTIHKAEPGLDPELSKDDILLILNTRIEEIPEDVEKTKLKEIFEEKEIKKHLLLLDAISQEAYIEKLSAKFKLSKAILKDCFFSKKNPVQGKPEKKKETFENTAQGRPIGAYTETWNAEQFAERNRDKLRYCQKWGKWFVYNGLIWEEDCCGEVDRLSKETVRSFYSRAAEMADPDKRLSLVKHAITSEQKNKRKAMIELAESELPVKHTEFDENTRMINVKNGALNLETCQLRERKKEDYFTKIINVNYNPDADCPLWKSFLNKIFQGNQNLIKYLQKAAGYSLTGSTREQCIFIMYGGGENGKSTFIDALQDIWGDYSHQAKRETFMSKNNDVFSMAGLRGKRLVCTVETDEGQSFAEAMLKQISGGGPVTARKLYKDEFTFIPQCKIWIATNHKPKIRGTDHAIWRRIKLIPFDYKFTEEEKDKKFPEKLQAEKEGILNWCIEGLRLWLKEELGNPEEITTATNEYKEEMDILGNFFSDCCITDKKLTATSKDLYEIYFKYCTDNGDKPLSKKYFGTKIKERGFKSIRNEKQRLWEGIGILKPQVKIAIPEKKTEEPIETTEGEETNKLQKELLDCTEIPLENILPDTYDTNDTRIDKFSMKDNKKNFPVLVSDASYVSGIKKLCSSCAYFSGKCQFGKNLSEDNKCKFWQKKAEKFETYFESVDITPALVSATAY